MAASEVDMAFHQIRLEGAAVVAGVALELLPAQAEIISAHREALHTQTASTMPVINTATTGRKSARPLLVDLEIRGMVLIQARGTGDVQRARKS